MISDAADNKAVQKVIFDCANSGTIPIVAIAVVLQPSPL